MDAKDALTVPNAPVQLIVDPNLNLRNLNNDTHTAGTTFLGQFLDHDVTFDTVSALGVPTDPERTRNARVPTLDLDLVYGDGPPSRRSSTTRATGRSSASRAAASSRTCRGSRTARPSSPTPATTRTWSSSGLQAAFIKFHNRMVDKVRDDHLVRDTRDTNEVFREARDQTRWHYQTMLLKEFLPQVVGQPMVDNVLRFGGRF
jgi:hypothetical protein